MAKASDNQFPSVLLGEGSVPTSPGAGTQRIYLDTADHKLKRVNSSGTVTIIEGGSLVAVTEVTTPSSPGAGTQTLFLDSADHKLKRVNSSGTVTTIEGGGSGSTVKDPRWSPLSGETTIDEFNDASLDAAWTRVDGTPAPLANVDWAENADILTAYQHGADTSNASHGLVRAIGTAPSTGDAWVTCVTLACAPSTNYAMVGLVISDGTTHGSGKQVFAELLSQSSAPIASGYSVAGGSWTNSGATSSTASTFPLSGILPNRPVYLRLVYKGSSQWRADFSPNGVNWTLGASLVTQSSFTPAYVGMYSRDAGSGTPHIASFEFLRRVAGVS